MNQNPADLPKREKKQQTRKPYQPPRDDTQETGLIKYFTASGGLYPPPTDVENSTDHCNHQSDLLSKLCHRPTCRYTGCYKHTQQCSPLLKTCSLLPRQVIKNPSLPMGAVLENNLFCLIICVFQVAQIHLVSTFSYSISLHLLLVKWRVLYFFSSIDICKVQPIHFTWTKHAKLFI